MTISGFFILLAIAILVRFTGIRLVPLVMPSGRLATVAAGWAGGFLASLADNVFWQLGPQVAGVSLVAAAIGCTVSILIMGLAPFIRIWLGRA